MNRWSLWIYVPAVNWLPWIFAAAKTRNRSWAKFAALYAAPLIGAMIASDFVSKETGDFLGGLYVLTWIGSMAHWTLVKEKIFEAIARITPPKTGTAGAASCEFPAAAPQIIERVIIREIVKIPCQYCGSLNESTQSRCGRCGAEIR